MCISILRWTARRTRDVVVWSFIQCARGWVVGRGRRGCGPVAVSRVCETADARAVLLHTHKM